MWPATGVSCVAGFVADDVLAIFKVFGAALVVSSVVSSFIYIDMMPEILIHARA